MKFTLAQRGESTRTHFTYSVVISLKWSAIGALYIVPILDADFGMQYIRLYYYFARLYFQMKLIEQEVKFTEFKYLRYFVKQWMSNCFISIVWKIKLFLAW